jgi:hypothetical protein
MTAVKAQSADRTSKFKESLQNLQAAIARAIETCERVFKPIQYTSIIVGLFLLWSFSYRAKILFPQLDISLLGLWAMLAVVSYAATTWLASVPFMAVIFFFMEPELQNLVPENRKFTTYIARYLIIFLPFLIGIIAWPLVIVAGISLDKDVASKSFLFGMVSFYTLSILLSMALFCLGFYISKSIYICRDLRFVTNDLAEKPKKQKFAGVVITSSILYYCWAFSFMIFGLSLALREGLLKFDASVFYLLVILFMVVSWHFVAVTMVAWKWYGLTLAAVMALFTIPFLISASQLGGIALRLVRLGGGIPISALANLAEPGALNLAPRRIDGCLVLWIGSDLVIQRPVNDTVRLDQCHINPRTPVFIKGELVPTQVDMVSRTNVLDISKIGNAR